MDILSALAVPVVGLIVTITLAVVSARRAAYDRAIGALDLISQGEAARARHRAGTLVFKFKLQIRDGLSFQLDTVEENNRVEDLFTILWATRRLDAVRRSLVPRNLVSRTAFAGPHDLLQESACDWIRYWVRPSAGAGSPLLIEAVATGIGAELDEDDLRPIMNLADAWGLLARP